MKKNTQQFIGEGVAIHNISGDFSEKIPEILSIVGQDDPIVAFIDSFGIKPLKFTNLLPLITRSGETDLILTFQTAAIPRLVKNYPDYVTEAVNSDEWKDRWRAEGTKAVSTPWVANFCFTAAFLL